MSKSQPDWNPFIRLCFWLFMGIWIMFVLTFFGSPRGVLGWPLAFVSELLSAKYLTLVINSFAMVGAYTVTRLLLAFRIGWKSTYHEVFALVLVFWVAVTGFALAGARCDIFVFCTDDLPTSAECEPGSDRQGVYCR